MVSSQNLALPVQGARCWWRDTVRSDPDRPGGQGPPHQGRHGPGARTHVQGEAHRDPAAHRLRQPAPPDPGENKNALQHLPVP